MPESVTKLGEYNIVSRYEKGGLRIAFVPGRLAFDMTAEFAEKNRDFTAALFQYIEREMRSHPSSNHEVDKSEKTRSAKYFIEFGQSTDALADGVIDLMVQHRLIKEGEKHMVRQSFGIGHHVNFDRKDGVQSISHDDDRFAHIHVGAKTKPEAEALADRVVWLTHNVPGLTAPSISYHEDGKWPYNTHERQRAAIGFRFEEGTDSRVAVDQMLLALKEGKLPGSRPQPMLSAADYDKARIDLAMPERGRRVA